MVFSYTQNYIKSKTIYTNKLPIIYLLIIILYDWVLFYYPFKIIRSYTFNFIVICMVLKLDRTIDLTK